MKITNKQKIQIQREHAKALLKRECYLWSVYNNYSHAKERAFDYCKNLQEHLNGYDFAIITHNTFIFTAGFYYVDEETGVVSFCYITPKYDYKWDAIVE